MQNLLSLNTAKQQKIPHPQCLNLGGDYSITQVFESEGNLHIIGGCNSGGVDAKGNDVLKESVHLVMPIKTALVTIPKMADSLPKVAPNEQDVDSIDKTISREKNVPELTTAGNPMVFKL